MEHGSYQIGDHISTEEYQPRFYQLVGVYSFGMALAEIHVFELIRIEINSFRSIVTPNISNECQFT